MIALVLLRVTVGWHFLYSGIWKVQQPNFSAAGFLGQAKGPFADHFHNMVPDIDGREHLDYEAQQEAMKKYADSFVMVNGFNEAQSAEAKELLASHQAAVEDFLTEEKKDKDGKKVRVLKEPFDEYLHKLGRLNDAKDADTYDIPFQQKRNWDEQLKLRGQAAGWSRDIDKIWQSLKAELTDLLGDKADKAPPRKDSLEQVDKLVTYTNIAIGVCLIAGLFTRFSALCGAAFLAQIVAAQPDWPGLYPPPHPSAGRSLIVSKEFVEMMTLVALGFLPTGRWAGLDLFVHNLVVRPLLGKKGAV